ncbi:oligoribonuclease [Alteromonadaceae bacterium M269]|nr:oligoribonuclease [Alteromonadaceae bacterium M269]
MAVDNQNLVWIDLEMTGLEPEHDRIIEIASLVTDKELNILAEGPVIAIHQSDEVLDGMDEWNTNTHGNSGLTQRCKDSKIDEQQALEATIAFLENYVDKGKSPLCGNTIGQDRRFLVRYMRELDDFFHYRSIDVSTIKELTRRWKPEILDGFKKVGAHTALADIRESVEELKYYREHCFSI